MSCSCWVDSCVPAQGPVQVSHTLTDNSVYLFCQLLRKVLNLNHDCGHAYLSLQFCQVLLHSCILKLCNEVHVCLWISTLWIDPLFIMKCLGLKQKIPFLFTCILTISGALLPPEELHWAFVIVQTYWHWVPTASVFPKRILPSCGRTFLCVCGEGDFFLCGKLTIRNIKYTTFPILSI